MYINYKVKIWNIYIPSSTMLCYPKKLDNNISGARMQIQKQEKPREKVLHRFLHYAWDTSEVRHDMADLKECSKALQFSILLLN